MIILQIDSYEQYHIGSKLNPSTDFNTLNEKLKNKLKTAGYSVTSEVQIDDPFFMKNPVELLATKGTVRVEFNRIAGALNTVGTEVESVLEVFEEVITDLTNLEYEIENLIMIFEILASVIMKVNEKPIDILNRNLSLDSKAFFVNDVQNWGINGIRVGGKNDLGNSFFSAFIEPNPTNPNSRFKVKLQYQTKEKDNILEFSNKLNLNVLNLIGQLV